MLHDLVLIEFWQSECSQYYHFLQGAGTHKRDDGMLVFDWAGLALPGQALSADKGS